jgi:hypothetical protein
MGKAAISEDVQTVLTVIESLVDQYPALVHTWRIAASTVYALQLYLAAASHPTPERSSEDDFIPDTKDNIKKLLDGESPSLDWERGFWFNAIIMRVDVLWERLFKLCLPDGVKCSGPSLYFLVEDYRTEKTNISYAESSFGQVRKIEIRLSMSQVALIHSFVSRRIYP